MGSRMGMKARAIGIDEESATENDLAPTNVILGDRTFGREVGFSTHVTAPCHSLGWTCLDVGWTGCGGLDIRWTRAGGRLGIGCMGGGRLGIGWAGGGGLDLGWAGGGLDVGCSC